MLRVFHAATFGWLCVETDATVFRRRYFSAATFGWLCVETIAQTSGQLSERRQPPSGGCVLKLL